MIFVIKEEYLVHVASRIQMWADECVNLHVAYIFSISCTFKHIHLPRFDLCSFAVALLLYALDSYGLLP